MTNLNNVSKTNLSLLQKTAVLVFAFIFSVALSSSIVFTQGSQFAHASNFSEKDTAFVENTIKLHNYASQYLKSNKISDKQIDQKYGDASYLTFAFMRQFNYKYQDRTWAMTAGLLDNSKTVSLSFGDKKISGIKTYPGGYSFMNFVKSNDPELYSYFSAFGIDGVNGFGVKVSHLAVSLMARMFITTKGNYSGELNKPKIPTPISITLSALMTEQEFDFLAGWAGDVQKLSLVIYPQDINGDYQDYYNKTMQGLTTDSIFKAGDAQYPWQCQQADADATNLGFLLKDQKSDEKFANVLRNYYYNGGFEHKFANMLKYDGVKSVKQIEKYSNVVYRTPTLIKTHWPLVQIIKRDVPEAQAKGMAQAFYDYYKIADSK
ncbi:MAG: hypothetical protein LBT91_03820 [Bifidobacteriaceae bacterium]|jgi:hypothetical protein|nr:hypothetical protein [Bifidobacteriaceae bacterium]